MYPKIKLMCLDENEISQFVDYLFNNGMKPIESQLNHVEECLKCKKTIFEVSDLVELIEDQPIGCLLASPLNTGVNNRIFFSRLNFISFFFPNFSN
jgi:hypothetical protein